MKIRKEFRWDGTLAGILSNLDEADTALNGFHGRSLDGSDLDNSKPYQQIQLFINGDNRIYPNSVLIKDDRANWYVINE